MAFPYALYKLLTLGKVICLTSVIRGTHGSVDSAVQWVSSRIEHVFDVETGGSRRYANLAWFILTDYFKINVLFFHLLSVIVSDLSVFLSSNTGR